MTTMRLEDSDDVILVEFEPAVGVQKVSRGPSDLAEKSAEAIERAMQTVRNMAKKTIASIRAIEVSERPTTFQVQFGIKLDAEAGAMVAKVGSEASITITMTWDHRQQPRRAKK
jgi:flavin-binding protein dodecin